MNSYNCISDDVKVGTNVRLSKFINLYGCEIGAGSIIGPFVEIQRGVRIGARTKISSHSFICEGVVIEDEVFVGHGAMFVNDLEPRAAIDGRLAGVDDFTVIGTLVRRGASIGTGAVVLCGITIGSRALIGAGAVVTHDVADGEVVAGVPARFLRMRG